MYKNSVIHYYSLNYHYHVYILIHVLIYYMCYDHLNSSCIYKPEVITMMYLFLYYVILIVIQNVKYPYNIIIMIIFYV